MSEPKLHRTATEFMEAINASERRIVVSQNTLTEGFVSSGLAAESKGKDVPAFIARVILDSAHTLSSATEPMTSPKVAPAAVVDLQSKRPGAKRRGPVEHLTPKG